MHRTQVLAPQEARPAIVYGRSLTVPRNATARFLVAFTRSGAVVHASRRQREREIRFMQIYVARLNIEHFRQLIAAELNPKKLDLLRRLLAEEEAKLARLLAPGATPSPGGQDDNVARI